MTKGHRLMYTNRRDQPPDWVADMEVKILAMLPLKRLVLADWA